MDHETARALLEWHLDAGVDEAMGDAPIDRYALEPAVVAKPVAKGPPAVVLPAEVDAVAEARLAAKGAMDIAQLAAAMQGFAHCDLARGARNFVFADGDPAARVMVVGEAPTRDEDREGKPFGGPAGVLFDKMFAAIGLSRGAGLYLTSAVPWRTPGDRLPESAEIAMMQPFLERHIALAEPEFVVVMGNTACQAVLGKGGVTRMRGQWDAAFGVPVLPMVHPVALMKQVSAKREAWADLLSLRARLDGDDQNG